MAWKCPRCGASHEESAGVGRLYIAEAARRLDRSPTYVKAMINQGVLRTMTIGGRDYIAEEDVDELARGGCPSDRHREEEERSRAELGLDAMPSTSSLRSHVPQPPNGGDPGMEFLKKFGRG